MKHTPSPSPRPKQAGIKMVKTRSPSSSRRRERKSPAPANVHLQPSGLPPDHRAVRLHAFSLDYRPGEGWRLVVDAVFPNAPRWLKPTLWTSLGGTVLWRVVSRCFGHG